jgi:hypothetical protein
MTENPKDIKLGIQWYFVSFHLLSSQIIQFNEISCQYPKAYREASHCHRFLDSQMKDLDLLRILPAY